MRRAGGSGRVRLCSGHKVITIWAGTEAITRRVSGGEVADIVLVAAPNIDRLTAEGKLLAGRSADIAKSGIGVAVRGGKRHMAAACRARVEDELLAHGA